MLVSLSQAPYFLHSNKVADSAAVIVFYSRSAAWTFCMVPLTAVRRLTAVTWLDVINYEKIPIVKAAIMTHNGNFC